MSETDPPLVRSFYQGRTTDVRIAGVCTRIDAGQCDPAWRGNRLACFDIAGPRWAILAAPVPHERHPWPDRHGAASPAPDDDRH